MIEVHILKHEKIYLTERVHMSEPSMHFEKKRMRLLLSPMKGSRGDYSELKLPVLLFPQTPKIVILT